MVNSTVSPFWVKAIGEAGDNLFHMRTNIVYGCAILRHYLENHVRIARRFARLRSYEIFPLPMKMTARMRCVAAQ